MKSATLTRGTQVDTDKCVNNIGNRYNMVIIAAARARELKRANRSSERREHSFPVVTALLEIQNGEIGKDYFDVKAAEYRKLKPKAVAK